MRKLWVKEDYFPFWAVLAASLLVGNNSSMAGWMADRYLDIDKILRTMPKVAIPLQDRFNITIDQKYSDESIREFLAKTTQDSVSTIVSENSDEHAYEPGKQLNRVAVELAPISKPKT